MSSLPKGWMITPLDNIASWGSGGTPKRSESSYYGGDIPWVKTGDLGPKYLKEASEYITQLGLDKSSAKLFKKGSVAIAMYGATIGKTSILKFDTTTNQACAVGQPIDGATTTEFLYYFLNSEKQVFIKKGKGGAQPNISQQLIKAHMVRLPPLAEQKRIVEKLDEVLAQVDTIKARLDGIPSLLKRFRQSVLASAVSGKLTEEWRGNNETTDMTLMCQELTRVREDIYSSNCKVAKLQKIKKPRKPSNIDEKIEPHLDALKQLPSFPEVWAKNVLAFVTDNYADSIVDGPFGASINVKTDYIDDGVPVIRMVNIRPFKFLQENRKFISEGKFCDLSRHRIDSGDVLFAKVGATTGDCCIYPEGQPAAMLSTTGSCRITVDKQIYTAEFLTIVLNSYRSIFTSITSQVAQPFLNMKTIKSITIPIPQVEEQKEIVRLVDQYFAFADTIEAQVKKAQARVNNLTQSILAKAFRGELVPQDPNDEPADKLLERIAQARIEAEALAKAAKKAETARKKAEKAAAKG